ncbi:hypothetical protein CTEN210_09864 [Chaetoceros tenuissimus]|uniref:folate gamma-glutamyl hydrolase n=1 Tax=Chaetoceros tenuissimus TaxID=426638 RepID=A0AAD3H808_9STRA|nr:hypothetical protein CTEN210_09864 [Chaetoceros tenuissimus]
MSSHNQFILLLSSLLIISCLASSSTPVIGILSQPLRTHVTASENDINSTDSNYIAASYVKWVELSGARSIPIPYDADDELIHEIFSQINGLLLPGGAATLPSSLRTLWKLAMNVNQQPNQNFPIWGTCLGFEFMLELAAEEHVLQTGFNSNNVTWPLIFPTDQEQSTQEYYSTQSKLYPTPELKHMLSLKNITFNFHQNGIEPETFAKHEKLQKFFKITSYNYDLNGRPFVSSIESIQYPIYGVQYHPEKNAFEYGLQPGTSRPYEVISHTREALFLSFHLASFFGELMRNSTVGEYTLVDRHPMVIQYPLKIALNFEEMYVIPSAKYWKKEKEFGKNLRGSQESMLS